MSIMKSKASKLVRAAAVAAGSIATGAAVATTSSVATATPASAANIQFGWECHYIGGQWDPGILYDSCLMPDGSMVHLWNF